MDGQPNAPAPPPLPPAPGWATAPGSPTPQPPGSWPRARSGRLTAAVVAIVILLVVASCGIGLAGSMLRVVQSTAERHHHTLADRNSMPAVQIVEEAIQRHIERNFEYFVRHRGRLRIGITAHESA